MKNNKGIASIVIILIVVGALAAGGYYFWSKNSPKQVACTMDAKICPDGSSVGRTGPNCEFAECPTDKTADWKIYEWNNISFKYPSNWVVEKEYYSTPAQQSAGEPAENIGLLIYPTNDKKNYIHIDGHQNSCDASEGHTACSYKEGHYIFTDSKNQEVLNVFNQMLSAFKLIGTSTNKPAGLKVISPNGGEQWQLGKTYTIKYNPSGITRVNIIIIDYRAAENCMLNNRNPVSAIPGEYSFKLESCMTHNMGADKTVMITPGNQYKVRVEDADHPDTTFDWSDNYFSIVGAN